MALVAATLTHSFFLSFFVAFQVGLYYIFPLSVAGAAGTLSGGFVAAVRAMPISSGLTCLLLDVVAAVKSYDVATFSCHRARLVPPEPLSVSAWPRTMFGVWSRGCCWCLSCDRT